MFYKIYYIYPNKQLESVEDYEYTDIQSATNCMFDYIWRHKKLKPTQKITDFINMDCTYSIGIFSINVYNKYNKLVCITNTNELKFSGKRIEIISRIKKIPITDNYPEHIFYVYDNLPDNTNVAVLCKNMFGENMCEYEADDIAEKISIKILKKYMRNKIYDTDNSNKPINQFFCDLHILNKIIRYKCHIDDYERFVSEYIINKLKYNFAYIGYYVKPIIITDNFELCFEYVVKCKIANHFVALVNSIILDEDSDKKDDKYYYCLINKFCLNNEIDLKSDLFYYLSDYYCPKI